MHLERVTVYKIDELAEKANVSARTIRYYVQRGLLPAPEFRGKDTAYDQGHLLRLKVIKRLQQEHLPLDAIQARIVSAKESDLERILADASGESSAPPPAPPSPPPPPPPPGRGGPYRSPGYQDPLVPNAVAERWDRVRLLPGLEIHVRSDASAEVRRAALEIQKHYGQGFFADDDRGSAR